MVRRGQIRQQFVVGLLVAQPVALQLDEDAIASEHTDDPIQQSADTVASRTKNLAAGQRDQPSRASVELFERERAFALGRPELHPGDQAAELPVSLL